MKTIFLFTGKTRNSYLVEGINDYLNRIKHYISFELIELPEIKNFGKLSPLRIKEIEENLILRSILEGDMLVLLDEKGKEFNSRKFASFIEAQMLVSVRRLVFAVGGAWGFSEKVYERANYRLSLSKMTFPHQLVRLIFMEQFYRALTILKRESYHND